MGWSSKREDDLERYRDGLRTRKEALSKAYNTTFSALSKHAFEDKVLLGKLEIQMVQFNDALGEIDSVLEFLTDASNEGVLSNLGLKKAVDAKDDEIKDLRNQLQQTEQEHGRKLKELRSIIREHEQEAKKAEAKQEQLRRKLKEQERLVQKAVELHPGLEYDLYDRPNPYKGGDG